MAPHRISAQVLRGIGDFCSPSGAPAGARLSSRPRIRGLAIAHPRLSLSCPSGAACGPGFQLCPAFSLGILVSDPSLELEADGDRPGEKMFLGRSLRQSGISRRVGDARTNKAGSERKSPGPTDFPRGASPGGRQPATLRRRGRQPGVSGASPGTAVNKQIPPRGRGGRQEPGLNGGGTPGAEVPRMVVSCAIWRMR